MSPSKKIKSVARVRPFIGNEVRDDCVQVGISKDGSFISVDNPKDSQKLTKFIVDAAYGPSSTQTDIFQQSVEPLLTDLFHGITITVFAYGVTSSGKTHTMQGTKTQPGIIPQTVRALLQYTQPTPENTFPPTTLSLSYMEIYKDEPYDLLVDRVKAPKLPIRENKGKHYVSDLTVLPFATWEEFDKLYTTANNQRSVAATNFNRASSRSHAVLSIEVEVEIPEQARVLRGKMNLVDLAGSENNKHTGNDASRMAESAAINKSLSALNQVVHAVNKGAARIPYRDSKLTRILHEAFGGNSLGVLICNLAPGVRFRQDTLNSLNFSTRAKAIENKPEVNEQEAQPINTRPAEKYPPSIPASRRTARPSLAAQGSSMPSRVPRLSAGHAHSRPSTALSGRASDILVEPEQPSMENSVMLGMTEEELDMRIHRLVEAEVAKRLIEVERQRALDEQERRALEAQEAEERRAKEEREQAERFAERERELQELDARKAALGEELRELQRQRHDLSDRETSISTGSTSRTASSLGISSTSMSTGTTSRTASSLGMFYPHTDLDIDMDAIPSPQGEPRYPPPFGDQRDLSMSSEQALKERLDELERKIDHEHAGSTQQVTETKVLSPLSKKKTARAFVSLGRQHHQKGDLEGALKYYQRALEFVPENAKLRDRIIEIEWAIKNNKDFFPSPKKPRKSKAMTKSPSKSPRSPRKGKKRPSLATGTAKRSSVDGDVTMDDEPEIARTALRTATNNLKRRALEEIEVEALLVQTPSKKRKAKLMGITEEEEVPSAPMKKAREVE